MGIFIGIAVLLLAAFILVYTLNKTSLLSGFLFSLFFIWTAMLLFIFTAYQESRFLYFILIAIAFGLLGVLLFGGYALILFLFLNARAVARREGRSLTNSLTLLLAIALTVFAILSMFVEPAVFPAWLRYIWEGLITVAVFYFMHVMVFLVSSILCNMARPRHDQDYIIVLGSGLIDGKVPPLLGGRIDRAIAFYKKQQEKQAPPRLVMSGGQGADEPLSEAAAMRQYALDKGIPAKDILLEDASTSTAENMAFSKTIMDRESGDAPYRCIYATSRYHLLRAGIYARRAGLRIDGIGAKTARYFVPNAFIREYIAFLALHKKRFILVAALIFVLTVLGFFATDSLLAYLTTQ